MKRMIALLLCVLLLAGCGGGDVSQVQRVVGESELYSESEIKSAMNKVKGFFMAEFEGCTLTELRYDEEAVGDEMPEWAAQYGEEEAIVLLSSFEVDHTGGDGSLNANSTYDNWKWILTRSGEKGWELRTWGYG